MLNTGKRYVGRRYAMTAAMLVVACGVSPAILLVSYPYPTVAASLVALACSTICAGIAFIDWKRSSELTIPSIASPRARPR